MLPRLPTRRARPLQAALLALLILVLTSLAACEYMPSVNEITDAVSGTLTATSQSQPVTPSAQRKATGTTKRKASATPTAKRKATPTRTASHKPTATQAASGLDTIAYSALPPQAKDTIRLIEAGGPFPYRQDGAVFQNREGILPKKPGGYYHEYTVVTPGSPDRGARRIVMGEAGEMYYTDDHYDSFRQIER